MILKTRAGADVETRDTALGALLRAEGLTRGSVGVTAKSVMGLPAWMAAVQIASQAVASLRHLGVFRGEGPDRRQIASTWQARFFGGLPNDRGESWFGVLAQTEASLTNSNNAYWLKLPDITGRVGWVTVLAPEAVQVKWLADANRKVFRIALENGSTSDWLDSSSVLHFRRCNMPGCIKDPTPIEMHRDSLASAVAKSRYEANYYDEGIMRSLAVTFPREMGPDEAQRWREVFQATHAGVDRQHQVRVFGGGASVATIGLSLEEAQYIESMQFSVQDVARITGVQASLIGASADVKQGSSPLSPEHEQDRWLRYGLGPRLTLIEETIKADPSFFGAGARDYPLFDSSRVVHGDIRTETERIHMLVQAGVLLPDEGRAELGYDPLPNGVGQIPQIVPVGGAPNPAMPAPSPNGSPVP